jgi:hypothetical protein
MFISLGFSGRMVFKVRKAKFIVNAIILKDESNNAYKYKSFFELYSLSESPLNSGKLYFISVVNSFNRSVSPTLGNYLKTHGSSTFST